MDIEDPDVKTAEIQKIKGQIKQNLVQVSFREEGEMNDLF